MRELASENEAEPPVSAPGLVYVVDDEPSICWAFERLLRDEGHEVQSCASVEKGLELVEQREPDLLLLDIRLPKQDGLSALPEFRRRAPSLPIIIMTAFGDLETAVTAVRNGATDYITKPFDLEEVRTICIASLGGQKSQATCSENDTHVSANDRHRRNGCPQIVGKSPAMQQVFKQIALVADSELAVLITGETGTGKELVAEAIHWHSSRQSAPYLPVAPAAYQQEVIESELFGHVKGAFTGADSDRAGVFEHAEGGTVLLDEIGDLPLAAQVKLLRVLDQKEYSRVGDVRPRPCNVRILAATNHDLAQAVQAGSFREDLYYRLHGLHMHLPPLRERRGDIRLLSDHFLRQFGRDPGMIRDSTFEELEQRAWNGNVRELRNALHHGSVLAGARDITIRDFPPPQPGSRAMDKGGASSSLGTAVAQWFESRMVARADGIQTEEDTGLHAAFLAEVEPLLIQLALDRMGDNRSRAAQLLGLHRSTLREKLKSREPGSE